MIIRSKIDLYIVIAALVVGLLVLAAPIFANGNGYGDDGDVHTNVTTDVNTDVTTNVATDVAASASITGGTTSLSTNTRAYSVSGSDMEIADCMATHAILFGLWQGTHINKLCLAAQLDNLGEHEEAAMMRCSLRKVRKVYGDKEACVAALRVDTVESLPSFDDIYNRAAMMIEEEEADDLRYQVQQEELEYVQEELAAVKEQLEQRRAPRTVQTAAPPHLGYTDEQRAQVQELLK